MKVDSLESEEVRKSWPSWATLLSRYGLDDMAAWFLEAMGPLMPVLHSLESNVHVNLDYGSTGAGFEDMLNLLEDPDEGQAFIAYLKGNSEL